MPDVIGQVTLKAGGKYHPPGTVVTIEDPEEAARLVEDGDVVWASGEEPPRDDSGEVEEVEDLEEDFGPEDEDTEEDGFGAWGLAGVDFASDNSAEYAAELGLRAEHFEGFKPSGKGGYTKRDVDMVHRAIEE